MSFSSVSFCCAFLGSVSSAAITEKNKSGIEFAYICRREVVSKLILSFQLYVYKDKFSKLH